MSVDFYPRKEQQWVTQPNRYPFQQNVASLDGSHCTKDYGNDEESARWYAWQAEKMKHLSPHLMQDGFDLSYDETLARAVLQDPVGLDFRMPSEMQEFLDSHKAVNANPTTAGFTTHPQHTLRLQPRPIAGAGAIGVRVKAEP